MLPTSKADQEKTKAWPRQRHEVPKARLWERSDLQAIARKEPKATEGGVPKGAIAPFLKAPFGRFLAGL
ncbi:MAG: hypothetical protein RBS36_11380, partial [Thiomicrospira sp.]|nr:hypothetical protein [Thiomicrospira sp.]